MNASDTASKFIEFADDTNGASVEKAAQKMNAALLKVGTWFQRSKLNLNPSKTRYMIFNSKCDGNNYVRIGTEPIERVWEKGKEKSFKLVGLNIDENLKWTHHINKVAKKINSAIYGLGKASKTLNVKNKKLIYTGLIHSHIVYGLPIWGLATKDRLSSILTKQKAAIHKIYNLRYRYHTKFYFLKLELLQLPELIDYTTLCYIKSGVSGPPNVRALWTLITNERDNRRQQYTLSYTHTPKQWIHKLAPIAQVKLWNRHLNEGMGTACPIGQFKNACKLKFLLAYRDELHQEGYDIAHMFDREEE